jgi:thiamine-phosphate pyrophosphorylase
MPVPFRLPRFYPILDTGWLAEREIPVITATEALLQAGVKILQYRHKELWQQTHFDQAKRIAELCHEVGVLFVINDRADYARLLGAALHIGQTDLPPLAARRVVSDEVVGLSTHNSVQLARGDEDPVEYVSLGPIFPTESKLRPDPTVGVDGLKTLRSLTGKPLVAIGGVTIENASGALEAGADSVAVISGLLSGANGGRSIRRRAEEWIRVLSESSAR